MPRAFSNDTPVETRPVPRGVLAAGHFAGNGATLTGNAGETTLRVLGNVVVEGAVVATGDVVGASDRALKCNLEVIEHALDRLEHMHGYTFDRLDMPGGRFAGLVAQEVQHAVPEAAHALQNNTLGIAYGGVCAVLVQAVKELNERVLRLEGVGVPPL